MEETYCKYCAMLYIMGGNQQKPCHKCGGTMFMEKVGKDVVLHSKE